MTRPCIPNARPVPVPRAGRGFTLIELMVAMVVSSIVILGIFAFSSIQQHTTDIHERHVRVQRALEGAMWSVSEDVQMAGLGWTRYCTELRIWDPDNNELINPGGVTNVNDVVTDPVTGEPYWVLRDGLQAHWNSTGAVSLQGNDDSSSAPSSAADAFDVFMTESDFVESTGVFSIDPAADVDAAAGTITVHTSTVVTTGELEEIQQLFPPGSFIVLGRDATGGLAVHPTRQGQCVLLQITGDVTSPADGDFIIPVAGTGASGSGFNDGLATLTTNDDVVADCPVDPCSDSGDDGGGTGGACGGGTGGVEEIECDDWDGDLDWVIPVGRVRWSRYEIDYSIPQFPYLVRYDIIGFQNGTDPDFAAAPAAGGYPHCSGTCPAPSLHLFGSANPPEAIAIGPMIEDMQVAVGCDAYTADNAANALFPVPDPDDGYSELDQYTLADGVIDEQAFGGRDADEWLGNAASETWAPDCVYWGTGEYRKAAWELYDASGIAPHRFSPAAFRITLAASAEFDEEAGSLATDTVQAVEDRAAMTSPVGARQRFLLTETFAPQNLRWRDPSVQ